MVKIWLLTAMIAVYAALVIQWVELYISDRWRWTTDSLQSLADPVLLKALCEVDKDYITVIHELQYELTYKRGTAPDSQHTSMTLKGRWAWVRPYKCSFGTSKGFDTHK